MELVNLILGNIEKEVIVVEEWKLVNSGGNMTGMTFGQVIVTSLGPPEWPPDSPQQPASVSDGGRPNKREGLIADISGQLDILGLKEWNDLILLILQKALED